MSHQLLFPGSGSAPQLPRPPLKMETRLCFPLAGKTFDGSLLPVERNTQSPTPRAEPRVTCPCLAPSWPVSPSLWLLTSETARIPRRNLAEVGPLRTAHPAALHSLPCSSVCPGVVCSSNAGPALLPLEALRLPLGLAGKLFAVSLYKSHSPLPCHVLTLLVPLPLSHEP